MSYDRLKGPLRSIARRADPLALYRCMYSAVLKAQSANLLKVDVQPDDPLLPPMSNIPLRHGIPGLTVRLAAGAGLLVGWDNGNPTAPFAALWSNPSTTNAADAGGTMGKGGAVLEVNLSAVTVRLGGDATAPLLPIDGVVTGQGNDAYTSLPYWMLGNASTAVFAKK